MKLVSIIFSIFVLSTLTVSALAKGRIFQGWNAEDKKHLSQALIEINFQNGERGYCGGSVIDHNWILTAAHCVYGLHNVTIYLGSTRRYESDQIFEANADDVIIHAYYNHYSCRNDVALIKTNTPIKFNDRVGPVELPIKEIYAKTAPDLYIDRYVTICGWGRTDPKSVKLTLHLQCTEMQVLSNADCLNKFEKFEEIKTFIKKTNLCANGANGTNTRTCGGDSGSGMFLDGTNILIGMTSFGLSNESADCSVNLPRVYTRITSFIDWINKNIYVK